PVHLHTLTCRALTTSSRLGSGLLSSNIFALAIIPGVQKPHCTAPFATKARPRVLRTFSGKPSIVIIDFSATFFIGVTHARAGLPSISIKQAPQAACPEHPSLTKSIPFLRADNVRR